MTDSGVAIDHRYRRWLLYCLFLYANPVGLGDVAHQLTVWEHGRGRRDDHRFIRRRLATYDALRYDHLPALREADLVVYEPGEDAVELGPAAARIEPALEEQLRSELPTLLHAERTAPDAEA